MGLESFRTASDRWSRELIAWGNPQLRDSVTKSWPLARLDEALLIVAAYFVLVAFGMLMKWSGAKEAVVEGKEGAWYRSPLKIFIFVYNCVQVALCGYMMGAAIWVPFSQGYHVVCNAFIDKEVNMANVVYVFYLSKILDFFDTFFIVVRRKWTYVFNLM